MKVEILPAAFGDLLDGYAFYEKQSAGVGSKFLDSLFSDIDSLAQNAGIHPVHYGHYHRRLASHFPFAIYYRVREEAAIVYAVLDCRRDPTIAHERLGE